MPVAADFVLLQRQWFARRDPELPCDEVKSGDRLRHGMLDLQTGVHLHEIESVGSKAARGIDDEFDRAGPDITDRLAGGDSRLRHDFSHRRGRARRRTFLDHLLMAALQRTIALEEMHDVALPVAEYLHLDMTGTRDIFFDEHARIAEGALRLAHCALQRILEIDMRVHPAHPLAAAPGDRLDEDGIADLVRLLLEKLRGLIVAVITGRDGNAGLLHQRFGGALQAHCANGRGRRPDKDDSGGRASLGEFRILREKAIAGMDAGARRPAWRARRSCRPPDSSRAPAQGRSHRLRPRAA